MCGLLTDRPWPRLFLMGPPPGVSPQSQAWAVLPATIASSEVAVANGAPSSVTWVLYIVDTVTLTQEHQFSFPC